MRKIFKIPLKYRPYKWFEEKCFLWLFKEKCYENKTKINPNKTPSLQHHNISDFQKLMKILQE